jgi:segregation and condensation protein A
MTEGSRRDPEQPSGDHLEPRGRESQSDSESASGERSEPRAERSPEDDDREFRTDGRGAERPDDDFSLNIASPEARAEQEDVEDLVEDVDEARENRDEQVEPVELLVQLAKEDEIEPWDIDIVAVTDKFLSRLDDADLRTGGRALFYASVLLRMKSDALLEEPDDEPEEEPWDAPLEDGEFAPGDPEAPAVDPFDALESEIDRRIERKRARGMPRTLDELVHELRERERWWKESREYDTSDSPSGYSRGTQELEYRGMDDLRMDDEPTEGDVTGTAHQEDIEAIIGDVESALREQYEAGRAEVLFAEVDHVGGSVVESFLAVLFLAHRGRVRLRQDELFGDLWVQDPNADAVAGEAIAD